MIKTISLYVRITPEVHDELKERAAGEQTTVSTVARQALVHYLTLFEDCPLPKNNTINYSKSTKNDTSDFQDFMKLYQQFKDLQG